MNMSVTNLPWIMQRAHVAALPRPPRGPGDGEEDNELPMGDPPDDDETDDPSDEDEGEQDDEPIRGAPAARFHL